MGVWIIYFLEYIVYVHFREHGITVTLDPLTLSFLLLSTKTFHSSTNALVNFVCSLVKKREDSRRCGQNSTSIQQDIFIQTKYLDSSRYSHFPLRSYFSNSEVCSKSESMTNPILFPPSWKNVNENSIAPRHIPLLRLRLTISIYVSFKIRLIDYL
jgi:hypothetical protein